MLSGIYAAAILNFTAFCEHRLLPRHRFEFALIESLLLSYRNSFPALLLLNAKSQTLDILLYLHDREEPDIDKDCWDVSQNISRSTGKLGCLTWIAYLQRIYDKQVC